MYGTECVLEVYQLLGEIVGPASVLRAGSPEAFARGDLEKAARSAQINTFGGGVNEIQREIVATLGLGLPRPGR